MARRYLMLSLWGLAALVMFVQPAGALLITLRSGNGAINTPDAFIRYLAEPSGACGTGFSAPFTAADFSAAETGPAPFVVTPIAVWLPSLACDPVAQWIALDPNYTPRSLLYAYPFDIPAPCCIDHAFLNFCWAADDQLGDAVNAGAFLNGVPLPISGGGYSFESGQSLDVTSSLHCGHNVLYVYQRDVGCAVAGTIFSATFDITECLTPAGQPSWGRIKALYR